MAHLFLVVALLQVDDEDDEPRDLEMMNPLPLVAREAADVDEVQAEIALAHLGVINASPCC